MFQEHARHAIWNQSQHPLKHTLADFGFSNPALPGISNLESAFNYVIAVLFPQTLPAVSTPGDLPLVGNTINDFRVVLDDGDGKAASYRWEQREGDLAAKWYKIYDMDWGSDSVMEAYLNVTQDLYVWKRGRTDTDETGTPISGLFAGQRIWGGTQANENLTLDANSFDSSGFVQSTNTFRPTANNTLDVGTAALSWRSGYFKTSVIIDTLTLSSGSISDSSGTISFGATDLTTTGDVSAFAFVASDRFEVGTLTISAGSIIDSSNAITFGSTSLVTTGTITGASGSSFGTLTLADGSITDSSGSISFGTNNLSTTGTVSGGDATFTKVSVDNLRLDGNTISVLNANGNLIVQANGTGVVDIQSSITSLGIAATGVVSVTGQLNVDNLRVDGNTISSTNLNGNIVFTPNGTGIVETSASINPSADGSLDLGSSTKRFQKLFFSTGLNDGTNEITAATLLSFRDANVGATTGMTLFYDGSKWVASLPDTEITHSTLSGLTTGDAGHTQFALLAGRTSGQSLVGGTGATENLVFESTSNGSKGLVLTKDIFAPFTNASFSGSWSGTDLGKATNYWKDIYSKGELKGARFENYTFAGLPSASAQNIGRQAYTTDTKKVYVDTGTAWKVVGSSKYASDVSFDGTVTTVNVDVSAEITDARLAVWQLCDNANDFDRIYCTIKTTSASNVQITTHGALPAGSYRLIGIE